jgi:hypothetical protein
VDFSPPCFVVLLYGGDFSFMSLFAVDCGVALFSVADPTTFCACFVVVLLVRVFEGLRNLLKFVSFGKSRGPLEIRASYGALCFASVSSPLWPLLFS